MTQIQKRLPVFLAAMLVTGMALLAVTPTAARQTTSTDSAGSQTKQPEATVTVTGRVAKVTTSSDTRFALQDAAGKTTYYLEVGPKWYHGTAPYPLDKYVGQQVTVKGTVGQPNPNKPAKPPRANQPSKPTKPVLDAPVLEVYMVNNDKLRDAGKPPWAGGPKQVQNHPGNNGKANGQGNGNGNGNGNGKGKATAPGQNKDKGKKPSKP